MKICFLAPASVIHTVRWVNALVERGHEVTLITMHSPTINQIDGRVIVYQLKIPAPLGYYLNVTEVKRLIKKIKPDIINTHYASGYGTLSRCVNFYPTLLSVWGSDVFDFPYEGKLKENILRKNLIAATKIASTSWIMKEQTEKFVKPRFPIEVTPFGVEMDKFKPMNQIKNDKLITIGIVKKLEKKYGVKYLIEATYLLINKLKETNRENLSKIIRLIIVGEGSQLDELKTLANNLDISKIVTFEGAIPHNEVSNYLNKFDIYCAPSILDSESFGVAIVEASACEIPVIVSNVGGLSEVVKDGETGFIVSSKNAKELSEKLYELVLNKDLRVKMGKSGRKFVLSMYNWSENVEKMEKVYESLLLDK